MSNEVVSRENGLTKVDYESSKVLIQCTLQELSTEYCFDNLVGKNEA
jgi:hypothetical protein